jgi:hypothetical protein
MQRAGFEIERVIEFNRISRPGWYINGRLLKRQKISHLQLRIFTASSGCGARSTDGCHGRLSP